MMKLFAVRDVKADAFGVPMSIATTGLAKRAFEEAILGGKTEMSRYPEDYMLYELGTYDPNSGRMEAHPLPIFVQSATDVKNQAIVQRDAVEPTLPLEVKS